MGTDPLNRLLKQLDDSQWWSAEKLQQYQFDKLAGIIRHAAQHVPHYQDCLEQLNATPSQIATPDHWRRLPVITRYDLQEAGSRLHSAVLPPGHEPVVRQLSSGSTGTPVESLATAATGLFWRAMTLREHQWHNRDYSAQLASIRQTSAGIAEPPDGPAAFVLDVGIIMGRGWAVVEVNECWACGIYACNPGGVLDPLLKACVPASSMSVRPRWDFRQHYWYACARP